MTSTTTLRSSELNKAPTEALLRRIESAGDICLRIDAPLTGDPVWLAAILATISRRERTLSVTFPSDAPGRAVLASLQESLVAPVLWGAGQPRSCELSSRRLVPRDRNVADKHTRTICVHTSSFPLDTRMLFQARFEDLCRAASLVLPPVVYGAASTIAFETASNAEEYGAFEHDDAGAPEALRYLIARLHIRPPRALTSAASSYFRDYIAAGHATPTSWLEVLVVDAGVGTAYPSFYTLARSLGRDTHNIFEATFDEEKARLEIVLNTGESTKGHWGRIINSETAKGEGTRFVKARLSAVRGYVSLLSGRARAEWWYARTGRSVLDVRDFTPYRVSAAPLPLFRGSIWHVLVPLDTQLALALGAETANGS